MHRKTGKGLLSEGCLSPNLKRNLTLKSFVRGEITGTGLPGKGSPVTGKVAQKRGGKLSKIENSALKDKIKLFEIFQGKKSLKTKTTEDLVIKMEFISNNCVAGKDQVRLAGRLRTNWEGSRELWSLGQKTMWPGTGNVSISISDRRAMSPDEDGSPVE